jgi:putative transposase
MPRKARFFLPNIPNHVVQRGRNRDPVFFEAIDYHYYLEKLKDALDKYQVELHAYVLMTNHVHLLMSAKDASSISQVMQYVGRYYVPYINQKYGFSGSLWEGRFKSSLIDSEAYLFSCMRYIELNPLRANMVEHPSEYTYSSYHCNALNQDNSLVTPHNVFCRLSDNRKQRSTFYNELFKQVIPKEVVADLKRSYQTGTPLGSKRFKDHIEKVLNRKIGQTERGRPKQM